MTTFLHRIRRRLADESAFALVVALGALVVLAIMGTSAMLYTTQNYTSSARAHADQSAFTLAEAGINNALAVLNKPSNNALTAGILPTTEAGAMTAVYEDGTAKWWGSLDPRTQTWRLNGKGFKRNPAAVNGVVTRLISTTVRVRPSLMQPANNPAWNYIVSLRTGDPDGCDEELANSVDIGSPLYVFGNLCLNTPSSVSAGPMVVKGYVKLDVNTNIGSGATPVGEVHVANGCSYKGGAFHSPCGPSDKVWATVSDSTPVPLTAPTVDLDYWYQNATPGPKSSCTSTSGVVPVFDNDTVRNNSVPQVFNLTPIGSTYSCVVRNGSGSIVGQLSWDHVAKVLTVNGTIFIDGSVSVDYGQKNVPIQYNGQATIYVSGTLMQSNTKLCGGIAGGTCDFAAWNPNTEMLLFVTNGQGGQVPMNDGVQLKSSFFQGGLWAQSNIELDTTTQTEGPMIAATEIIGQTVTAHTFPLITSIPAGAPGVPTVYAQPDPPGDWRG
jgi:hypothetical protein